MPSGLIALLDDVATIAKLAAASVDDVGLAATKASAKAAGVVIDAVRCAKLALDRGIGGALIGPAGYFMKSPPRQISDHEARERTEAFIRNETHEVWPVLPRRVRAKAHATRRAG